jgi:uncharacterized protein YdhG (YjbR/CyaY superfamily)
MIELLNMQPEETAKTVAQYCKKFPPEVKRRLLALQSLVKELAPDATEKISYRMPAYFLNGRLVYFAAHKNHIGLYPMASGIEKMASKLKQYHHAMGSVQFPHDQSFPLQLIREIIELRVKENRHKTPKKNKTN